MARSLRPSTCSGASLRQLFKKMSTKPQYSRPLTSIVQKSSPTRKCFPTQVSTTTHSSSDSQTGWYTSPDNDKFTSDDPSWIPWTTPTTRWGLNVSHFMTVKHMDLQAAAVEHGCSMLCSLQPMKRPRRI